MNNYPVLLVNGPEPGPCIFFMSRGGSRGSSPKCVRVALYEQLRKRGGIVSPPLDNGRRLREVCPSREALTGRPAFPLMGLHLDMPARAGGQPVLPCPGFALGFKNIFL